MTQTQHFDRDGGGEREQENNSNRVLSYIGFAVAQIRSIAPEVKSFLSSRGRRGKIISNAEMTMCACCRELGGKHYHETGSDHYQPITKEVQNSEGKYIIPEKI